MKPLGVQALETVSFKDWDIGGLAPKTPSMDMKRVKV